jgi:hypothetical protein
MEGETSELEIDSELVMSFYDQYQADDLAGKVYGVNSGMHSLDPDSGGTGGQCSTVQCGAVPCAGVHGSCLELKAVLAASPGPPDVSSSVPEAGSGSWNLPDLLVGLEGGQVPVTLRLASRLSASFFLALNIPGLPCTASSAILSI